MREVDEELLQYIWLKRLLKKDTFLSAGGKKVNIIDPGTLNTNSGPDFFNAKIQIDEILLSGNIEIHLKSSDWLKHKHQEDDSYNKILLHVVLEHDVEIEQNKNHGVEVIEVRNYLPDLNYLKKDSFISQIPCYSQLKKTDTEFALRWIELNQRRRSEKKVLKAKKLLDKNKGDHLQTFYTMLLSNFGFNINQVPFELLSELLPVKILFHYQHNLFQLEALLLGMAGLLSETSAVHYLNQLQKEFQYLRRKHQLTPIELHLIKFSRMRPFVSAPYKLAQFASLFHSSRHLFSFPQEYNTFEKAYSVLSGIRISEQWKHHFPFATKGKMNSGQLGEYSIEILLINTFAVFQGLIQKEKNGKGISNNCCDILNQCKFENNYKTRMFVPIKRKGMNARHSQGLIQLYDDLCSRKKCLQCAIGRSIVKEDRIAYSKYSL